MRAEIDSEKLSITFGSMCEPIAKQLAQQGRTIPADKLDHIQMDADAIARLVVRGIITEASARRARQKVFLRIKKEATIRHGWGAQC